MFKDKKNLFMLIATIVMIVIIIGMIINANSERISSADNVKSGYRTIEDIPGVSFYINQTFVDEATAITEVSNAVSFSKNSYYIYKNGKDKFLLFNMDELVIAAQKGTAFEFQYAADKEDALASSSILNIWFSKGDKKFNIEENDNRCELDVAAGVSINSELYGDFCGKLVTLTDENDEEWSLFVGVPGTRYDKLGDKSQNGISAIADSFQFSENINLLDQDIYAVEINGNDSRKQKVEAVEETVEDTDDSLNLTNQNIIEEKDDTKAYSSSIYNMLSLGDNGLLSVINYDTAEIEEPIIQITDIYSGHEAEKIIKDYCKLDTSILKYFSAPDGQNWQVAKYNVNYRDCTENVYVNIKLIGLDGEKLKYRGVKYAERCFDITDYTKEDGNWVRSYYVFYLVPNGCYEYALMCGDNFPEAGCLPAFYHIYNDTRATSK